jgi:hypothetical protein
VDIPSCQPLGLCYRMKDKVMVMVKVRFRIRARVNTRSKTRQNKDKTIIQHKTKKDNTR